MRFALVLVAACANTAAPVSEPSNHEPGHREPSQRLVPVISVEFSKGCPLPHPITITIDGVARATVVARCKPVPVASPGGVIITDSSSPTFTGPAFDVPGGRHELGAHDAISGVFAQTTIEFPAHERDHPETMSDTILVIVYDDAIQVGVARRDRIITL